MTKAISGNYDKIDEFFDTILGTVNTLISEQTTDCSISDEGGIIGLFLGTGPSSVYVIATAPPSAPIELFDK